MNFDIYNGYGSLYNSVNDLIFNKLYVYVLIYLVRNNCLFKYLGD